MKLQLIYCTVSWRISEIQSHYAVFLLTFFIESVASGGVLRRSAASCGVLRFSGRPRYRPSSRYTTTTTGQFAEANRSVGLWPIRSLALSFPGPLTPWNFRCLARNGPGTAVGKMRNCGMQKVKCGMECVESYCGTVANMWNAESWPVGGRMRFHTGCRGGRGGRRIEDG